MRAPFQVLVIPYIKEGNKYLYAILKRRDLNIWQAIAGGGEGDESPVEAFRREAFEEAGIDKKSPYIRLASTTTIPVANIHGFLWGNSMTVVPEIAFGVGVPSRKLAVSNEHAEYEWVECDEAMQRYRYDSNKSAVWELDYCLKNGIKNTSQNIKIIEKYYNNK